MKTKKKNRRKRKNRRTDDKGKHDVKCEEQNRKGQSSDVLAEAICDHFPPEIMKEIFHRLPVKSLVKFTSVCKAWKSFITDHTFISNHLNRTIPASNRNGAIFLQLELTQKWPDEYFIDGEFYSLYPDNQLNEQFVGGQFYSLYSDNQLTDHFSLLRSPLDDLYQSPYDSIVVGTCYGLVCYVYDSHVYRSRFYSPDILIWNPLIRKYLLLPCPIMPPMIGKPEHIRRWLCFGFGFDSRNQDYKVVRLMTLYNKQDTPHFVWDRNLYFLATPQVEVYSLTARSWRSITVRFPQLVIPEDSGQIHQVVVNGVIHWGVCRRCDGQIQNFILSFDAVEEIFGELPLPPHMKEDPCIVYILGGGDLLAVLHTYRKSDPPSHNPRASVFCIWVMKIYGVAESWTEVFRCDSECYGGISEVLGLSGSGKVVFRRFDGAIVLLDPMTDLVKPLEYREYLTVFVGSYVESLFLINKEHDVLSF